MHPISLKNQTARGASEAQRGETTCLGFFQHFRKESSSLNMSEQSNFRSVPTGNQEYHSSICNIVRCMPLLPPLLPCGYTFPRKREWAGWNYLNIDLAFRLFGGHSAFGFIESQGRKEFLFIGNERSHTDISTVLL